MYNFSNYNFYLYVYEHKNGTTISVFQAICENEECARTMAEIYAENGKHSNIISEGKLIAHYDAQ